MTLWRFSTCGAAGATAGAILLALWLAPHESAAAPLEEHTEVRGTDVPFADVRSAGGRWRHLDWDTLSASALDPGRYELRFHFEAAGPGFAVQVPACAGRGDVLVDGRSAGNTSPGSFVQIVGRGPHEVVMKLRASAYERRIACGERPRVGAEVRTIEGLGLFRFTSPFSARGGGQAVVFMPRGHDVNRPATLLVGAHPWNGSIWTYAGYAELLREARARDVVLLMPSGLGNSLYTADAEQETLRAVDALSSAIAIDRRAVSIWGASMGGAGAMTIGFHHPDRFATVTSFFGDSKYDLSTYVRFILPDEAAAHRVNAFDVADNARLLSVWLIHGEDDRTSPIAQSAVLAAALEQRGFPVRFDRVAGAGHSGALVARFLPEVVARAASARLPSDVTRVSYRSVRLEDAGAYGVRIVRESPRKDAFVEVEKRADGVHITRADGVVAIRLERGALTTLPDAPPPIVRDAIGPSLDVAWDPAP